MTDRQREKQTEKEGEKEGRATKTKRQRDLQICSGDR